MNLYPEISRRKSSRQYDEAPLEDKKIAGIKVFADSLTPLLPGIKTNCKIVKPAEVKSLLPIIPLSTKAPHYIIISSEKKDGYLINAGFMYQQLSLYLSFLGLGCVWLGSVVPAEKVSGGMEFIIVLAFGNTYEKPHRQLSGFKRKPISQIANGNYARIESARLAPSGLNLQPWYFVCEGRSIHVCCKKTNILTSLVLSKMNQFSTGLAICHLWVSGVNTGKSFNFRTDKKSQCQTPKRYYYVGTIEE